MSIKDSIVAGVVVFLITATISKLFLKIKGIIKEKYNDNKSAKLSEQRKKELEEFFDYEENKYWERMNSRISDCIDTFNSYYDNRYSKSVKSTLRISLLREYVDISKDISLTNEQKIKIDSIQDTVIKYYREVLKSNGVSKKEKNIYPKLLDDINRINNDELIL